MSNPIVLGAGLVALSSLPAASAAKVCTKSTDSAGNEEQVCRDTFPPKAKVAIAVVVTILTLLLLALTTFLLIRRARLASSRAQAECTAGIEESQMTGPATVLGASYHPGSGHSIYTIGSAGPGTGATGNAGIGTAVIPPTPSPAAVSVSLDTPVSARFGGGAPPKTAPAHRSTFSNGHHAYPFSAHGNAMASPTPPKSAFVSGGGGGGFPRPLLAGRLKDRIRERPPSASSLVQEFPRSDSPQK